MSDDKPDRKRKTGDWRARRPPAWNIPAFALDETLNEVRQYLLRLSGRPDSAVNTGRRSGAGDSERASASSSTTWKRAQRAARFIMVTAVGYHGEWVSTARPDRAQRRRDTDALKAAQAALAAAADAVEGVWGEAYTRAEKAFEGFRLPNVSHGISALAGLLRDAADRMDRAAKREARRPTREGQARTLAQMVSVMEEYLGRIPTQSELDELLKIVFGAKHRMDVKRPIQAALSGKVDKGKLLSPAVLRELSEMLFDWNSPTPDERQENSDDANGENNLLK